MADHDPPYRPASYPPLRVTGLIRVTCCVRGNAVVDTGCGFTGLYTRAVPSHAIELAAVYLDQHVAAVFSRPPDPAASPQQKQDLAPFIPLRCAAPPPALL